MGFIYKEQQMLRPGEAKEFEFIQRTEESPEYLKHWEQREKYELCLMKKAEPRVL